MATSVTDNFNRADGDVGGNWTDVITGAPGRIQIVSNETYANAVAVEKASTYTATALDTAHYSVQAKWSAGTNNVLNLIARSVNTGTSRNGYIGQISKLGTTCSIIRLDSGAETSLVSTAHTATNGNIYSFSVAGGTLTLMNNGAVLLSTSDATYSAVGAPGLGMYNNAGTDERYDDFAAQIVGGKLLHGALAGGLA